MTQIEQQVLQIRTLLEQGDHKNALKQAETLLLKIPENRDVLYMIAVAQRYQQQPSQALETLKRLEQTHPTYSRLHQERGHNLLALRQPGPALNAFLQAVNLNHALPAAWHALHILYRSANCPQESEMALGHVNKLKNLPPDVVTATSLFSDGETHEAERIIRAFLQTRPDHVEAMRLLARIGMKLDALDDAEFLLESVLAFAPDYHLARHDYVRVLLQRHRHGKALEECGKLLRADPANRDFRAAYAAACQALGKYEEAIDIYRDLAAQSPNAAELHLSIGHALKTAGHQSQAIAAYETATRVRPSFGDAWWSLANLKTYKFGDADIERMRGEEADGRLADEDRIHLCFALGKALEDRADYAQSFACYRRGNTLQKARTAYDPETIERNARLQKTVCGETLFESRTGAGCPRPDPIFIVGLPRAGSTLLEQILASHSQVEGTMELADISRMAVRLQGRDHREQSPRYPAILRDLPPEKLRQLGERYLADTQIYRAQKPFFIDKNPNNFRHLGLIALILPNARIIDARREPMACCFSNYKQLFAAGQEFTYSLQDIARYYRSYEGLMDHWNAMLPGRILRVQHEDVVANLAQSVERILNFCNLPFEPHCIDFHKTERSIRTASSEQVRLPIYREGLHQWKNFEPWLTELKESLLIA